MAPSDVRYLDEYVAGRSAALGKHVAPLGSRPQVEKPRTQQAKAPFAVVLHFDEFSERRIRQAWAALDENGVPSAGSTYEDGYRPHVTLAIVNTPQPEGVAMRLRRPLADVSGMSLTMTALGFFLTNRAPAYLAVAPTRRLVELHDEVHRAIGPDEENWSYYQPGNWMPHCTLAMDIACQTTVADALGESTLPILATVDSAHLVELPTRAPAGAHRRTPGAHRAQPSVRRNGTNRT